MNDLEQRVVEAIAESRDELVELASALIRFDTTARDPGDPARDEAALQALSRGAPDGRAGAARRGLGAAARGRARAAGAVPPRLRRAAAAARALRRARAAVAACCSTATSTSSPASPRSAGRTTRTRPSCATGCSTAAAPVRHEGRRRRHGAGRRDARARSTSAWRATCSSTRSPTRSRPGPAASPASRTACAPTPASSPSRPASRSGSPAAARSTRRSPSRAGPGHAELLPAALARRRRRQRDREGADRARRDRAGCARSGARAPICSTRYLSPPDIVPTLMRAGEWSVTYPASCAITSAVLFPPAFADADGYGSRVRAEVRGVGRARLRGRPLARRAPAELRVDGRHPAHGDPAGRSDRRRPCWPRAPTSASRRRLGGLDSWYDGATYTLSAGTPSVGFGPRSIAVGHTIDEYVPVDDLVRCAQAIALAAVRFCGTA